MTIAGPHGLALRLQPIHPPGPVAERYLRSTARRQIIRGPIRSGKTWMTIRKIPLLSLLGNPGPDGVIRARWYVCRQTYDELRRTTVKDWHEFVPREIGRWREGDYTHDVPLIDAEGRVVAEIAIEFLALERPEDQKKLTSANITAAWVNELQEMPKEIVDALYGRVGRYPAHDLLGWYGMIADSNAPEIGHWLHAMELDWRRGELPGTEFYIQPSGLSPAAENLANMQPGWYQDQIRGASPRWVRRYVENRFGADPTGEPVYPQFRDEDHVAAGPLAPIAGEQLIVGVDFGTAPSALICQRGPYGQLRALRELSMPRGQAAKQLGQALVKMLDAPPFAGLPVAIWADPAGLAQDQSTGDTPIAVLRKQTALPVREARTNQIRARLDVVRALLDERLAGQPMLLIDPGCVTLIGGLQGGYALRRIQLPGEARFAEEPAKGGRWDGLQDCLQYAALGAGFDAAGQRRSKRDATQRQETAAW